MPVRSLRFYNVTFPGPAPEGEAAQPMLMVVAEDVCRGLRYFQSALREDRQNGITFTAEEALAHVADGFVNTTNAVRQSLDIQNAASSESQNASE